MKQLEIRKRNNINAVEEETQEIEYLFLGAAEEDQQKCYPTWEVDTKGKNGEIRFKIDTGADVTVIAERDIHQLGMNASNIMKITKKLCGPSNQPLGCLGYIIATFTCGDETTEQL